MLFVGYTVKQPPRGKCKTCKYREDMGCNYSGRTDRTRLAQAYEMAGVKKLTPEVKKLMDPKTCAFYKNGKRERKRSNIVISPQHSAKKVRYNWEHAAELYAKGQSDVQISKEIGCSVGSVFNWRKRTGRAANEAQRPASLPRIEWERAPELYSKGMSDAEIATALRCSPDTVRGWRWKNKLKANTARIYTRQPLDEKRAKELYDQGLVDSAIARELGVGQKRIRAWRDSLGIKSNYRRSNNDS